MLISANISHPSLKVTSALQCAIHECKTDYFPIWHFFNTTLVTPVSADMISCGLYIKTKTYKQLWKLLMKIQNNSVYPVHLKNKGTFSPYDFTRTTSTPPNQIKTTTIHNQDNFPSGPSHLSKTYPIPFSKAQGEVVLSRMSEVVQVFIVGGGW